MSQDEARAAIDRLESWLDSTLGDVQIYPADVRTLIEASRKPEAAPSDTDTLIAKLRIARSTVQPGETLRSMLIAQSKEIDAILDAAERTSQPVPSDTAREALVRLIGRVLHGPGSYVGLAPEVADAVLAAGFSRSQPVQVEHECEFGCSSDMEHLQRAYEDLKAEYAEYRQQMKDGA